MPEVPPIGARIAKYLDVPDAAKGPAIPAGKGYRTERLGAGLYMVTDNAYQSMFLVYESGVVVVDAPPSYAAHIKTAIAEVTGKPITHLVYSHAHADHIGGAAMLGGRPIIVAHAETKRLLARSNDRNRPLPTVTFTDGYQLKVGSQVLELQSRRAAHQPGNLFIYAPAQKALMHVDVVYPGWMMWRRFGLAEDVPAYFDAVEAVKSYDFAKFVGGHVARVGSREDVVVQAEFMADLKAAALKALQTVKVGAEVNPLDLGNPWAVYDTYIDRVAASCVNALTPKWKRRLAAFDVYIWDQCYAMEQSLRID
ncbi:MBL fold metallo-hydrolase [Gemmatimonas groenlandica]|uniref:MBL fold metallo-hydrolase n=2 Tax=Gemmatimonas groenlandica TaxID=2732249 RepID=A0A6M4IHK5_9BACT|nr:MBL fold metallo-hydrolase [Gemmatimonas groenlandica]